MHVLIGIAGLCGVLWLTVTLDHTSGFPGLFYAPAVLLVGAGPLFIALVSFRPEELWSCLGAVRRGLRFRADRSRAALYEDLTRFATEVKRRRPAEALAVAEGSSHELLRQLAPLVVKQYAQGSIESTAATATFCLTSALKRSEDVLGSLARVAPATGLVGTVLGLITLLKDLSDFQNLGPAMALALLCTLYGLVLANGVYQPLGRMVHSYAAVRLEESKLVTRALCLVSEDKPLGDLRALFELASPAGTRPGGAVVPASEAGAATIDAGLRGSP